MSSIVGKNIKVCVFGQSHSEAIGVTIDGLPAGFTIDQAELQRFMLRRAPGQTPYSTNRKEQDEVHFISGVVDNTTCGAPLTAVIYNTNTRLSDYTQLRDKPRPGHSDFGAAVKFDQHNDISGGGHFSARLTAPLCIAGGICLQLLAQQNIEVAAHLQQVYNIEDEPFNPMCVQENEKNLDTKSFPTISDEIGEKMKALIAEVKASGDSIGGIIECRAMGLPVGLGTHMFDGVENRLSTAIFGIPAVKGIEFGNGFDSITLKGSENNDGFRMQDKHVVTESNRHGGVLGGMTSGMPLIFRLVVKPTSSIFKPQHTVSLSEKCDVDLQITGRHDPCVAVRAVPVVEAVTAIVLYDLLQDSRSAYEK